MDNPNTLESNQMSEEFLHYIWNNQLFTRENLVSEEGLSVEVISTGIHNTNAGPDFENARINIDGTIWAGNVEIHTDSALWEAHGHQNNKQYNNVVLHVVQSYSKLAITEEGSVIPTLKLNFDDALLKKYEELKRSANVVACANDLDCVDAFVWSNWKDRLGIERLEEKTTAIKELLLLHKNNWEACFYQVLSKSFGFKVNALPFEMLARCTSIKLINKYSSSTKQLEALLFGQAGFLEDPGDGYTQSLAKEYQYLKRIHKLKPMEKHLWKFMRLRPSNFPTIRIAQLAALINSSSRLFSKLVECESLTQLRALFACSPSEYWQTHYTFAKPSARKQKTMGKASIDGLLVNTVIPFLFIYGRERAKEDVSERAVKFLEELKPERNSIIEKWANENVEAKNAFQSQALIQLYNNYCLKKNCLYCQVGNAIIKTRIK